MDNIKIISHRGANMYAPQNTIHAFRRSLELSANGFETDVHLTADGVPVICHNYTIDETSNGKGAIASMTLNELLQYDFGGYYSRIYKDTKIPTLDEFLELVAGSDIEVMNIELKTPKDGNLDIVAKTIDAVKEHGLFDRLLISSFSDEILVKAKEIDENCKTGYLYCPKFFKREVYKDHVKFAKSIKADALHPMHIHVNKKYVELAHEAGIKVNPWTVNSEKKIRKMIECKVDGIITDCPDGVKTVMKKVAAEKNKLGD